jgi:ABC-2 type transport system ATP-binding protein
MNSTIVIEARNITKRFPTTAGYKDLLLRPFKREKITAVSDINFVIRSGDIFFLLGPNGAGKTTLLKILCGLIIPTEGVAFINRFNSVAESQKIRKEIGYVINEERSFYWRLTGRQNLKFFATLNNMSNSEIGKRIDDVLELTNLKDDADKAFKNYSSGMKQRLAIARALLTDPGIVIMDEPTRSLDPLSVIMLKDFLNNTLMKKRGKTFLIATHDVKFVEAFEGGTIGIINKGKMQVVDSLANLKNRSPGEISLDKIFSDIIQREKV